MYRPSDKPRRPEFNHRRWALVSLLAFIGIFAYQSVPYVRCSYQVADAYQLGYTEVDPSDPDHAMQEYRMQREEGAQRAAGSGGFLAALRLGAKQCWGMVGLGYGHSSYWTWAMFGCLGLFFVLLLYGYVRRPRWKKELGKHR